jgi:thioesterase domain-containing protein
MRYKTIRGFVKGKRRYSWLYDEYDEKKPVLVFVQGIVTLNDTAHLHALFDEYFNVFVIEPIQNHYERIFVYEHYDEVVAFYLTIAQLTLPEDAKIVGFIGFSFGGAIAYGMAAEWEKMTGEKLPVIMGDTTLPTAGKRAPQEVKKTTVQDLRKMTEAFEVKEHEYTDEELQIFANLNNMVSTLNSQNSLAPYDGEVIFLNAHLNTTEKMMREKMDALHKNAPQAEIHDFVDYSHGSIFVKEEMHSFNRRIAQKLLGKGVDFGS